MSTNGVVSAKLPLVPVYFVTLVETPLFPVLCGVAVAENPVSHSSFQHLCIRRWFLGAFCCCCFVVVLCVRRRVLLKSGGAGRDDLVGVRSIVVDVRAAGGLSLAARTNQASGAGA